MFRNYLQNTVPSVRRRGLTKNLGHGPIQKIVLRSDLMNGNEMEWTEELGSTGMR